MNEHCTALTPCPHMDSLHINDFQLEIVAFCVGAGLGVLLMSWWLDHRAQRASNPYKDYLESLRNLRMDRRLGGASDYEKHNR